MKKLLVTACLVVSFFVLNAGSAAAVDNDVIKVGLRYGSSAMFSANLENAVGSGYEFGYYEDDRRFQPVGWTDETAISMTAAGEIYLDHSGAYTRTSSGGSSIGAWHVEIDGFGSFEDAQDTAWDYDGYPAWIDQEYVVRVGDYSTEREAQDAADRLGEGYAARSSNSGVLVTVTRTTEILFEFDCGGRLNLGVLPSGGDTVTWFRGYKYPGGFEYFRTNGGDLSVVNVTALDDYVRGVLPSEMGGGWPLAALEAQAVCARTYACRTSKHFSTYGFDVCNGIDCQVYNGLNAATDLTDQAVENTAGEMLYYDGYLVQDPVYHSSNGGATEDAKNVWGREKGYLKGKEDPYEARTSIPNYSYSVTYTSAELTWILEQKGYDIGTVRNVYVSEYTPTGNVAAVTFEGSRSNKTVTGLTCSSIFYSSTYGKSVRSLRFSINGGGPSGDGVYVNGSSYLSSFDGVSAISGTGTIQTLSGNSYTAISSSGTSVVSGGGSGVPAAPASGSFTITGSGNGHSVGMSQYGAKAMAELGYTYEDILHFYYTDVTIR
ncbi:MAG: SpoIID/LytB domain-containing protein [Oscillibacter sp.]|nr:SpoIID/LytB domain-containing protein [Oscillibacter sp.]